MYDPILSHPTVSLYDQITLKCSSALMEKVKNYYAVSPYSAKKQVFLALFGRFLTLINAKEPFLALLGEKN